MELIKENKSIDYSFLNEKQINIINILLRKIDKKTDDYNYDLVYVKNKDDNYLHINFNSEQLANQFHYRYKNRNPNLKIKLFELSLTEKYDSDLRRRITIYVDSDYFEGMMTIPKIYTNIKMNEYTYISTNFIFVVRIPVLENLNSVMLNNEITTIDLSPLVQIKSIGDGFMRNCEKLLNIDLSTLSKLESIGNNFMNNCERLTSIKLSNLKSIGYSFMNGNIELESIDLSPLLELKSIEDYFMNNCKKLRILDLSTLSKLESIGNYFMNGCEMLTSIKLYPLPLLHSIGTNFMLGHNTVLTIECSEAIKKILVNKKGFDITVK